MRSFLWSFVLAWSLTPHSQAAQVEVIDRVLARVGAEVITLSDARAAIAIRFVKIGTSPDPIADAVAALVDRELMLGDATRYAAPAPDPAAVDAQLAEIRRRFSSEAEFGAALNAVALTTERLGDIVRDNLRIEAYVDQMFSAPAEPTDEEAARYYEQHRADFTRDGRQLSLDEARDLARARAAAERRQALVAAWLNRLRQRIVVINLYRPAR